MAASRREGTTSWIRSAAGQEFTEVGPRALSLSNVAKRAFVSVGAVYERWPSRDACISDVIGTITPTVVDKIGADWSDPTLDARELVNRQLHDAAGLNDLRHLAEAVFAARDDVALRPQVLGLLDTWQAAMSDRVVGPRGNPAGSWWAMSTWLAVALLRTSGCALPPTLDDHLVQILGSIRDFGSLPSPPAVHNACIPSHPSVSVMRSEGDATTMALVDATHQIVSERGVSDADLRSVAREAGVTTGAVYRRFSGRSELLVRAFVAGLTPDRYAWTPDFLAHLDADGLEGAGAYLGRLCQRIWLDETEAHLLLEFTVAAHTDSNIRASIFEEMNRMAVNRQDLFSSLIDVGLIRSTFSPEALSWNLQIPPVGMRLLASIGVVADSDGLERLLREYLFFLLSDE